MHTETSEFNPESAPKHNEGHFRALLRMRIKAGDESLNKHFQCASKNATYISSNIQNQIIESSDKIIKRKIAKDVNAAKCFSVVADETCGISSNEKFCLCVRYVKS